MQRCSLMAAGGTDPPSAAAGFGFGGAAHDGPTSCCPPAADWSPVDSPGRDGSPHQLVRPPPVSVCDHRSAGQPFVMSRLALKAKLVCKAAIKRFNAFWRNK